MQSLQDLFTNISIQIYVRIENRIYIKAPKAPEGEISWMDIKEVIICMTNLILTFEYIRKY